MEKINTKYKIVFSLYFSIGYLLLSYFVNIRGKYNFYILFGRSITYPYGKENAYCFVIIVFFLMLVAYFGFHDYLNLKGEKEIYESLLVSVIFWFSIAVSSFFLGADLYYFIDGLFYGIIFGIIWALQALRENFSFVHDLNIPLEVRIFKLSVMYDKWFKMQNFFTAFLATVVVGGGLNWILGTPRDGMHIVAVSLGFVGVYISVGILVGIYWNVIQRINLIESMVTQLK